MPVEMYTQTVFDDLFSNFGRECSMSQRVGDLGTRSTIKPCQGELKIPTWTTGYKQVLNDVNYEKHFKKGQALYTQMERDISNNKTVYFNLHNLVIVSTSPQQWKSHFILSNSLKLFMSHKSSITDWLPLPVIYALDFHAIPYL